MPIARVVPTSPTKPPVAQQATSHAILSGHDIILRSNLGLAFDPLGGVSWMLETGGVLSGGVVLDDGVSLISGCA